MLLSIATAKVVLSQADQQTADGHSKWSMTNMGIAASVTTDRIEGPVAGEKSPTHCHNEKQNI